MAGYEIDVSWSDADDAFVARVPELPGCMAHGSSREEAGANAENAIQAWIAIAEEFGDAIPRSRNRGDAPEILIERETDGRWIAEVPSLPGVMVYGESRAQAIAKVQALALHVIADRIENDAITTGLRPDDL
ncbi:type II toxin-antitoxin system HicB family antitoxin [Longimicrobium sp.]|uniref:type II toxin-antitoxin system HicB family antitoxin n=1 Tax=Longimicrobium sp. TaxID=2029185 RepID=UPI002F9479E9